MPQGPAAETIVFVAPPVPAKTTIARLLGSISTLYRPVVEGPSSRLDRAELVAYMSGDGDQDRRVLRTRSRVLFIDEAYSLSPEDPARFRDERSKRCW